ncbi:MAG: hypothetical protein ACT4QA_19570 [Panacagrimonas sp.]
MSGGNAIDALRGELGAQTGKLPDLSAVPEPALAAFVESLRKARADQKQLLTDSAEHALRLVPALLRPVVRKALFG